MNRSTAAPRLISSSAYSTTCLAEALAQPVQQTPDRSALIFLSGDQTQTFTFAQMWAACELAAAQLAAAGISAGDRLLLVGHHDPPLIQAWIGAVILGAVPAIFPYLPSAEPSENADQ